MSKEEVRALEGEKDVDSCEDVEDKTDEKEKVSASAFLTASGSINNPSDE